MDVKLSVMLMTALYSGVFVAANDNMMIAQCTPRSSDGYQHHINIVSTSYQLTRSLLSDLLFDCPDPEDK